MVNLILIPLIGIAFTCVGYGPLSMKRNPEAGLCFAIVGFLFRLVGPLLIVWGLFFWLLGAKAFRGGFGYMKAVEAIGLSNMIAVLGAILVKLLVLTMNNISATPSLMLLVKPFDQQNPAHMALQAIDVMTLWLLLVRSVALARLSRVSFAKAAVCVFGIWVSYTTILIGFAAAMIALGKHMGGQ